MALTVKQKKDWAKLLYVKSQMTQKEIAEKVQVTEKTLSKWVNGENWEVLRGSLIITKEQELRRIYLQINALNNCICEKEEGKRFANSKEADTLTKLAAAARSLETENGISQTVDTFIEFTNWLQGTDYQVAIQLSEYMDGFVKHKLGKY